MRDNIKKSRKKVGGIASRYNFSSENGMSRAEIGSGQLKRPGTSMRQQSVGDGTTSAGRSVKEVPENS